MIQEHDGEPIRGLPERLPAGEHILWQGEPAWKSLAVRVFHTRALSIYCGVILGWRVATAFYDGHGFAGAVNAVLWLAPFMLAAVGILALLAWWVGRTTVYTITNRRVVMRYGIAFDMALNIPFTVVASAALKTYPDGTGNIALTITGPDRMAYLALWPHARPWRLVRAEPMLRTIPEAAKVAELLAGALQVKAGDMRSTVTTETDGPDTGVHPTTAAPALT